MNNLCVSYHEQPILNNINWTIKRDFGTYRDLMGLVKVPYFLNGDNTKGYGQDLYLFGVKKEVEKTSGI
jgi:molybdate transport system ATP-binding protein